LLLPALERSEAGLAGAAAIGGAIGRGTIGIGGAAADDVTGGMTGGATGGMTGGGGVTGAPVAALAATAAARLWPQDLQNRAPGALAVPHFGHAPDISGGGASSSLLPQDLQNLAAGLFSVPHLMQRMIVLVQCLVGFNIVWQLCMDAQWL
jgi:hypothetical protein